MNITAGILSVAVRIQESAAAELSAGDIGKRLADALNDCFRGTGNYGYYIDHFGDGESGDVIYSMNGDTCKAPYSIADAAGAAKCVIDLEAAVDVVPRTLWEPEADESEHYAAMEESLKKTGEYTALPLYERFIAKTERDAADSSDFAGKGKSFPILKPADVMAAVHAMGRAGSGNVGPTALRSRIIAIATRKGWAKYLPKAWQSGASASEAEKPAEKIPASIPLRESAATLETIHLSESKADYEIKLIAPGKGAMAFYPADVLRRDGPGVFKAGTHVYLNHATKAEESARPEGDVRNLAGVLTTAAEYHESHAKGPGLYARMKVFADHAALVEEKAPHVGMSIRASGIAESGKQRDGVPVLKSLVAAQSVDVVTRAGAGGMILTESAQSGSNLNTQGVVDMTEAEVTARIQEALQPFRARAVKGDARTLATTCLEGVTLPGPAKLRIVERVLANVPTQADGELDAEKLKALLITEAAAEGEYLASITGAGRVQGMGAAVKPQVTAQEAQRLAEADKVYDESTVSVFESLGMPKDAAQLAAKGRAA